MKIQTLLVLCTIFIWSLEAKDCMELLKKECNETEYHSYVDCIRKRIKRATDCDDYVPEECEDCQETCLQCDCDYCAINSCRSVCTNCCPNNPPCTTHRCCHKTCHAKCKSSTCRTECRKTCTGKVNGGGNGGHNGDHNGHNNGTHNGHNNGHNNGTHNGHNNGTHNGHNNGTHNGNHNETNHGTSDNKTFTGSGRRNITTIINLHNIINNTNIVDVPVVLVNNTNINNITLGGGLPSTNGHTNGSSNNGTKNSTISEGIKDTCCYVIEPKQCIRTQKYPYIKCFHLRRKVCGSICKASIVHEQHHQICDQTSTGRSCHQQTVYIPQPQPRCTYQQSWPYVSCGVQQQQQLFCGGCYMHYGYPYPQGPAPGCSLACYDDGYGMGPYYRQGPFYRPGYAHAPSCYQIGSCGAYGYFDGYQYPMPGYPMFPGMGYPANTYENSVHIEPIPNATSASKEGAQNTSHPQADMVPLSPSYMPVSYIPQYSAVGYPYIPQAPAFYNLPPEVDIQATITHPEKESGYAEITISKPPSKRSANKADEEVVIIEDPDNGDETRIIQELGEEKIDDKIKTNKIEKETIKNDGKKDAEIKKEEIEFVENGNESTVSTML